MKMRTWIVVVVAGLVAVFAAVNWQTFSQPAPLSFLVASIDAPLGVVMLMLLGALTILYMLLLARAEISATLEAGRLARELEHARAVADGTEDSRMHAFQEHVDEELAALRRDITRVADRIEQALAQQRGVLERDAPAPAHQESRARLPTSLRSWVRPKSADVSR